MIRAEVSNHSCNDYTVRGVRSNIPESRSQADKVHFTHDFLKANIQQEYCRCDLTLCSNDDHMDDYSYVR